MATDLAYIRLIFMIHRQTLALDLVLHEIFDTLQFDDSDWFERW